MGLSHKHVSVGLVDSLSCILVPRVPQGELEDENDVPFPSDIALHADSLFRIADFFSTIITLERNLKGRLPCLPV